MLIPEGRDISDRLQAEAKIREQAALLDITTDAIFVRDLEHRLLFWNKGQNACMDGRQTQYWAKTP